MVQFNQTVSWAAKSQDCAIPDTSMKLSTLVKVVELMILDIEPRGQTFSAHAQGKIHFPSAIENLVLLDYTDQYLRLKW